MNEVFQPRAALFQLASDEQRQVLFAARNIASVTRVPLYVVGGAVRDLLATQTLKDIDLTVLGDARTFGESLNRVLCGESQFFPEFLTLRIQTDGVRVDISRARRERYPRPGALPVIEPGTLDEDMARRDFSVNALAISLWPESEPELVDPFHGSLDIQRRLLRVLHDESFQEDPTRILRGFRLMSRLDFEFEALTEKRIRSALFEEVFTSLSGSRLRNELSLLLGEDETFLDSLVAADRYGFLGVLDPSCRLTAHVVDRLTGSLSAPPRHPDVPGWTIRLAALLWDLEPSAISKISLRLGLSSETSGLLLGAKSRLDSIYESLQREVLMAHEIDAALAGLKPLEIALLDSFYDDRTREQVGHWRRDLRSVRLLISGQDLLARGFSPGPEIGRALQQTRWALLDKRIEPSEELDFATHLLQQGSEEPK